jgi:hypothetical protein
VVLRYVAYLLETLAKRELFKWVELIPEKWWHTLLFRDTHNWGGLLAVAPTFPPAAEPVAPAPAAAVAAGGSSQDAAEEELGSLEEEEEPKIM